MRVGAFNVQGGGVGAVLQATENVRANQVARPAAMVAKVGGRGYLLL
jgi:hypothetical protein